MSVSGNCNECGNPWFNHPYDATIDRVVCPEPGHNHPGQPLVRSFETGATRSSDAGRYDPEGFLSPLAIEQYCIYMQKNQVQPDGSVRSSDNWQKGIPLDTYMKGMHRHLLHLWCRHRGHPVQDPKAAADKIDDLCALFFNVQGMLHGLLKQKGGAK